MLSQIQLEARGIEPPALLQLLKDELGDQRDVSLDVKRYRALETAILVAIIGASGIALKSLIEAALKVAEKRSSQEVEIQGSSGRRIRVPVGSTKEELQEYVRLAKELDIALIDIGGPR